MDLSVQRLVIYVGCTLALVLVIGCDSGRPGNQIVNNTSAATLADETADETASAEGFPSPEQPPAVIKVIAEIPTNLEKLLSANDVKTVLGRADVRSIRMSPIGKGYWRHTFEVGDGGPLRLFVFENEKLKPQEVEGWDHSEPIEQLGARGRASAGIVKSELIGDSDEKVVAFERGMYLVTLTSISRESDSGHVATKEQMIELAKLVDSRLIVAE